MKKKLLSFLIGAGVLIAGVAYALPYQGFQGGTSYGTGNNPATTTVGQALVVASTSPFLTWTLSPLSTSSGLASYNVSSTNSYISVSTTTTSASLTFSTSSFGSNAFSSVAYYPNSNPSSFIALTALSGTAPITYNNGTGAIGLSTPLASNYGGTATTTALGTNAFNSTAYLPLTGGTLSGNVTGTSLNLSTSLFVSGTSSSIALNLPEGICENEKIVPSVSSNNLTVALKTLAGNNPSATDPVYCRIGGVVRSITAALSVTISAGTNTFNAGSAELATHDLDLFALVGYNATDGVTIGATRIPYGTQYGDFSATATNEKYAAISTITHAASTDYYDNIGRFAATLSAGAGYTWSVPTYTASNLINRPIYETRWMTYSPQFAGSGGSAGSFALSVNQPQYQISGSNVNYQARYGISNVGSWSGSFFFSLPMSVNNSILGNYAPLNGSLFLGSTNMTTASLGTPVVQMGASNQVYWWGAGAESNYLAWSGVAASDFIYMNTQYRIN
jgi:hypothetical protein